MAAELGSSAVFERLSAYRTAANRGIHAAILPAQQSHARGLPLMAAGVSSALEAHDEIVTLKRAITYSQL